MKNIKTRWNRLKWGNKMKNLGWYIIAIIMGLLTLSVTITEKNSHFISIFGYVGIFMIILGVWGILSGILHKEDEWIINFVLITFVTIVCAVLVFRLLGI